MIWDSKSINVLCSLFVKGEQLELCIVRLQGSTEELKKNNANGSVLIYSIKCFYNKAR